MITLIDGSVAKRLEDFGMVALMGHGHQVMPSFENRNKAIVGKFGLWNFGYEVNGKTHKIPIGIIEYDKVELQRKLNELASFLFDQSGGPKLIKLIYDYEPDKFYTVRIDSEIAPSRKKTGITEIELSFISEDPYKYSNVFFDEVLWGSEVITFGSMYFLGHDNPSADMTLTAPGTVSVTVLGQAVKPIIEITGSATDLVIAANGKSITVGTFVNDVWVIECEKYISYQNGVEKMMDMGNFILKSGDNTLTFTGSGIDLTVSVKFRDKWL